MFLPNKYKSISLFLYLYLYAKTLELVYNLEMCVFLTMITVIFMIVGWIAIRKNHGNRKNHTNHGLFCPFFEIVNRLLDSFGKIYVFFFYHIET